MQLIIKPTAKCNFNCTFCSAHEMNIECGPSDRVNEKIMDLINHLSPNNIIVTGGDPLCMDPEYYYHLREVSNSTISVTTNLKDFYIHPDKWKNLFMEDWFYVGTSFQYGNGRMWDSTTVFTEEKFIDVMNKFKEFIPNKSLPPFITVIGYDNEDRAIDHVLLAKRLNTCTKMNNLLPVGKSSEWYPRYKIYQIYLKIIDEGLDEYEAYCKTRMQDICPKNMSNKCSNGIRSCYVDRDNNLHVGICDDLLAEGHELGYDDSYHPKYKPVDPKVFIHEKCAYCQLCMLCNGCNLHRIYAKRDPNYCSEMKKLEEPLIKAGWAL